MNIVGLIVALLIGAGIGWLLSRRGGQSGAGSEQSLLETRLRSYERDLEAARNDLSSQAGKLDALKTELVSVSADLKGREVELGVLEEKLKSLEPVEAELE
ncbi:MAG TPA: hypothetical protein VGB07_20950, partial [Blastocatellia bacterium]